MHKPYKVAIIGGGAAGLLCAVELVSGKNALAYDQIVLFEKNDRVGKKLIATGNGQGNLSNANISSKNYYGSSDFIESFLSSCYKINIEDYFYNLGIPFQTDITGRQYPLSKQASAVLDIIRAYLSEKLSILTNSPLRKIKLNNGIYELTTACGVYYAESVVLATGGKAAKQFGTDGSSYAFAEGFGHTTTSLFPSLVQLKTDLEPIRALKGLKERAKVSIYDGDTYLAEETGDLLFTEYGVSGNAVFKISPHVSTAKNPILHIEFLPDLAENELLKILRDRERKEYIGGEYKLVGLVNKRVGQAVLKQSKNNSLERIVKTLKNFILTVTGTLGFDYAQVTRGGIDTKDINRLTYESLLAKNLYFAGEIMDVDGDCGGYNLTFAFVTGIVVAQKIKKGIFDL